MTALLFPTDYEAKDIVGQMTGRSTKNIESVTVHTGKLDKTELVVAIIGMGPQLSAQGTHIVLKNYPVTNVVLAGFAGALSPQLKRGQILIVQDYSSEGLINYLKLLPGFDIARVYPSDRVIASAALKQQIGAQYGCQLVDMETDAVARVVFQYNLEFLSIRAISDLATEDVPDDVLSKGYNIHTGQTSPLRLIMHLAVHRQRIKAFKDFLAPLPQVRKGLSTFLTQVIHELDGI
jgi:adenosylhomocysteine nucleosidase